eukprot:3493390-Rhodomonas_salina.2
MLLRFDGATRCLVLSLQKQKRVSVDIRQAKQDTGKSAGPAGRTGPACRRTKAWKRRHTEPAWRQPACTGPAAGRPWRTAAGARQQPACTGPAAGKPACTAPAAERPWRTAAWGRQPA